MANKFFTSDQHFNHVNILRFCDRPFTSVSEMNERLVANHNEIVKPEDDVYILGDLVFKGSIECARRLISLLNGKLYLIQGNHDKLAVRCEDLFQWIKPIYELTVQDPDAHGNKQLIVLCHYAMRVWNRSHHQSWSLFGHSHGGLPDDPKLLSIDVGVDAAAKLFSIDEILLPENYRPISYEEIKKIMNNRKAKMEQ